MNTVEKIHFEIDSAQARLLAQAEEILTATDTSVRSEDEKLLNKAERLAKLGFTASKEVAIASKIKEDLNKKKQIVVKTKKQAEDLKYFERTHPFSKILTVEELDRICDKYDLIYAPVGNYTMDIPEKNLQDIENCKELSNEDKLEIYYHYIGGEKFKLFMNALGYPDCKMTYKNVADLVTSLYGRIPKGWDEPTYNMWAYLAENQGKINIGSRVYESVEKVDKSGLFIAAPKTHFNLEGLDNNEGKKGWFQVIKSEPKDPIVFEFCRDGVVRVITKWGLEGEDPALTVPINN